MYSLTLFGTNYTKKLPNEIFKCIDGQFQQCSWWYSVTPAHGANVSALFQIKHILDLNWIMKLIIYLFPMCALLLPIFLQESG